MRIGSGLAGSWRDDVRCDRVLTNIKNAETRVVYMMDDVMLVVALAVVVLMVVAVPLGQIR